MVLNAGFSARGAGVAGVTLLTLRTALEYVCQIEARLSRQGRPLASFVRAF
jgi:hypothetical protein